MIKEICENCGRKTVNGIHPILGKIICRPCSCNLDYITKSRIKSEYRLKESDLDKLKFLEVDNPHYKVAGNMKLYLLKQVEYLAKNKYGSPEPYKVALLERPEKIYSWLIEDASRFHYLSPGDLQSIVAERMEKAGYNIQLLGNVYEKDGGIDIIATPKNVLIPYLLAIQVKHHKTNRKTPVGDIRDFYGALSSRTNLFSLGLVVTNTTFTPDANFFANNNSHLMRLRDIKDLTRWMQNDFDNEYNWRELPTKILLPNNKEIIVPTDRIWTPRQKKNNH